MITDSTGTGTYLGTTTIDGDVWPVVFFEPSPGNFYIVVYSDRPLSNIPNNLAINEDAVFCFLRCTEIHTEAGPVAVEDLAIGDKVITAEGKTVPVKWIGYQTVSTRFVPAERLMPVRVKAGALGKGLPQRDLTLTADQTMRC